LSCGVVRRLTEKVVLTEEIPLITFSSAVADDESLSTNKLIALLSGSLNKKKGF
jgi:hypothetical protein